MTRPHLTLVRPARPRHPCPDRAHDLPPAWDGAAVRWGGWSQGRTSLAYHLADDELACRACGLVDEPRTATGWVRTTRRRERPWLHAHRCRGCGHDVVHDVRTDEVWDLDATDYGGTGSTRPDLETLW